MTSIRPNSPRATQQPVTLKPVSQPAGVSRDSATSTANAPVDNFASATKSAMQLQCPTASTSGAAAVRPPPVRVDWELSAPWRAVQMVEQGEKLDENGDDGSYPQVPPNYDYKNNVAQNLKDFIAFGRSSLTPYEAKQIATGLGYDDGFVKTNGQVMLGDRVMVTYNDRIGQTETAQGIVARIFNDGEVEVLADSGDNQLTMLRQEKNPNPGDYDVIQSMSVVASALDDGRYDG